MNKEQLEELKKMRLLYEVCFVDEYASAIDDVTSDFDSLIEHAEQVQKLEEENKRYREALEEIDDIMRLKRLWNKEDMHIMKALKALEESK